MMLDYLLINAPADSEKALNFHILLQSYGFTGHIFDTTTDKLGDVCDKVFHVLICVSNNICNDNFWNWSHGLFRSGSKTNRSILYQCIWFQNVIWAKTHLAIPTVSPLLMDFTCIADGWRMTSGSNLQAYATSSNVPLLNNLTKQEELNFRYIYIYCNAFMLLACITLVKCLLLLLLLLSLCF